MRLAACAVLAMALLAAGCGYVGPVLPPSPAIPATITDLNAVERGDKIVVTFTTPARTTDGMGIARFSELDLRVGPEQKPPEGEKSYAVPVPPPSDRDDPQPRQITYTLDAADWTGQRLALAVRASVKKTGHYSAWSNRSLLAVIPPLERPLIHTESSANGIVLTWQATDDAQYKIERQASDDKQPIDLATVNEAKYVDVSAQFDKQYTYTVTANKDKAESLPSEPVSFLAKDIYPPSVPTGITIVAGPDSVNLSWQRSPEPDLQGYYVFRSTDHGPFEKQGGLVSLPTYVDQKVEHGKMYTYKISAIDKTGNESAQSSAVETQY